VETKKEQHDREAAGHARFVTTHWTKVLRAGGASSPDATAALEDLCRAYWYPLFAFIRAGGKSHEDAVDLTQEFFAQLLQKKWLADADPARGRFRSFLLAAMKHFLANQWHHSQRLKRGGGREIIALDALEAEERFALEPRDPITPDALFERRWALTVIQRAQARLAAEAEATGVAEKFRALEPALTGERTDAGYESLAVRFSATVNTVKSWVLRLRRRFREILREEVATTLGPDEDVDEELRQLLAVVGGSG
jgi:RNA polymerase sigma-70 factor (ECF subfamily)